jgi:hypothetical protein
MKSDESQDQARRIGETSLTRAILRNIQQYRNGSSPSPHYPLQHAQQPLTHQSLGSILQAALDLISADLDLGLDDQCEDLSQQEFRQNDSR